MKTETEPEAEAPKPSASPTPSGSKTPLSQSVIEADASDLDVTLVDLNGAETTSCAVPADAKEVVDVRFRAQVGEKYRNHVSWGVELSDPARNISYRIAQQGTLPDVVRWDGKLSDTNRIETRQRYFYRVLLSLNDDVIVTSNWKAFFTRTRSSREGARAEASYAKLYLESAVSVGYGNLKTTSFNSSAPLLKADIDFIFGRGAAALRFHQTAKELISYPDGAADIQHGRLDVGYRHRIIGNYFRAPWLSSGEHSSRKDLLNSEPLRLDVGIDFFTTTFRGGGNMPLDAELARQISGLSGQIRAEQIISDFGLSERVSVGYSVFGGSLLSYGFDLIATYEKYAFISPGIFLGYAAYTGKPSRDSFDAGNSGSTEVTNTVLSAGLTAQFHL